MGSKFQLSVVVSVALYAAMQATSTSAHESSGPAAGPGLQVRPMPDSIQSTLIHYKSNDMDSIRQWTNKLDEFLKLGLLVARLVGWIALNQWPYAIYLRNLPVSVASDDLWFRDVDANYGPYKKAQNHSDGNGRGLCLGFLCVIDSEMRISVAELGSPTKPEELRTLSGKAYRKNIERADTVNHRVLCTYTRKVGDKEVCHVSVKDFHPCTSENHYNYNRAAPCVFLKLDDTLNWNPKYYNTTELISEEMPEDLKQHIRMVDGRPEANTVWVSCEGESPADKEYIGPVQYIPGRGFPSYYYPFTNQEGYLGPLVAVLFERPRIGVVIMVKCKAWTRDSVRHAHFELLID